MGHAHSMRARRVEKRSVVYFVQSGAAGHIKIGYSKQSSLKKRMDGIQVGSPERLVLLATEPGGPEREAALHEEFDEYRHRGEWFRPGPRLLEYVEGLLAPRPEDTARTLRQLELAANAGPMSRSQRAVKRHRMAQRNLKAAVWLLARFYRRKEWHWSELAPLARAAGVDDWAIWAVNRTAKIAIVECLGYSGGKRVWLWKHNPSFALPTAEQLCSYANLFPRQAKTR